MSALATTASSTRAGHVHAVSHDRTSTAITRKAATARTVRAIPLRNRAASSRAHEDPGLARPADDGETLSTTQDPPASRAA
jgi:hypothetical protein